MTNTLSFSGTGHRSPSFRKRSIRETESLATPETSIDCWLLVSICIPTASGWLRSVEPQPELFARMPFIVEVQMELRVLSVRFPARQMGSLDSQMITRA